MFEVKITGLKAKVTKNELLTTGTVGAQIKFTFSDDWVDKTKTAVFKRCGKVIDVLESDWGEDNVVTIPPEMTEKAGQIVGVGIYGRNADGKKVTPTIYAPLGVVAAGADPSGDESTDPSLPVYSQIQAELNDIKDDLGDVAKRAVQSDWNQNDPEQPDYVKNRIAYDESEYVLAGTDYYTWAIITAYGAYPIPKVTVNGKTFYNIEATNTNTRSADPYIAYRLDDSTTITVYLQQMYITPRTELYTYSEKVAKLAEKFVPPISWIRGDKTANYIADRPGGYIEPSADIIGSSERRTSGGDALLPYADRINWVSIDKQARRDTPVRITGMYVDGTPFDACCIFGAVYEDANERQYGKNPFRFTYTDAGRIYSITAGVVKYCTIYAAAVVPWSTPFLPTFTKNTVFSGYGLPRTPSEISADAPYAYVRRLGDELVYSPSIMTMDELTDIKILTDTVSSVFFIADDPNGYLQEQFGIQYLNFPAMICRVTESAASVLHNYLYIYSVNGHVWKGDIVTPGYYVQSSHLVYSPVYYCSVDLELSTETEVVFTETNEFIDNLHTDRVILLTLGEVHLSGDSVVPEEIAYESGVFIDGAGYVYWRLERNHTRSDGRLAYNAYPLDILDALVFPLGSAVYLATVHGIKITASDIQFSSTLARMRNVVVRPGLITLRVPDTQCWFMPAPADLETATPVLFSQIYAKNGGSYVASLTYVSSDEDANTSNWTLSEQALFA